MVIYELDIAKVLHENLPPVSGVVVCYDAANKASFSPVEEFLRMSHFSFLRFLSIIFERVDTTVEAFDHSGGLEDRLGCRCRSAGVFEPIEKL
jgi:hypothetical protein